MTIFTPSRRNVALLAALALLVGGCGPSTPPAGPVKPAVPAPGTNSVATAATTVPSEYTSVFEDLLPPKGKDPFFPASHRRDPVAVVAINPTVHVDPILVLKGIIGSKSHRLAVINNEILETGEESPVRVPDGHVRVRCLEIGENYVVIKVEGEAGPKRLSMQQKNY